jgi:hypothetical protein
VPAPAVKGRVIHSRTAPALIVIGMFAGVGNCSSRSAYRTGLARSCDGRLPGLWCAGPVGVAWLCDLGRRVRCLGVPPLGECGAPAPPAGWFRASPSPLAVPTGRGVRRVHQQPPAAGRPPGPDHGHDPCRRPGYGGVHQRPPVAGDDQCAHNRSGRASARTQSRSLPRNGCLVPARDRGAGRTVAEGGADRAAVAHAGVNADGAAVGGGSAGAAADAGLSVRWGAAPVRPGSPRGPGP